MDAETKAQLEHLRGENAQLKKSLADARAARNLYKPLAIAAEQLYQAEVNHDGAKKKHASAAAAYQQAMAQSKHNGEL